MLILLIKWSCFAISTGILKKLSILAHTLLLTKSPDCKMWHKISWYHWAIWRMVITLTPWSALVLPHEVMYGRISCIIECWLYNALASILKLLILTLIFGFYIFWIHLVTFNIITLTLSIEGSLNTPFVMIELCNLDLIVLINC